MSVDTRKVAAASKALKKYLKDHESSTEKSQLFEDDGEFIYLVVKSRKHFSEERVLKPKLIELPTSLWQHRSEKPSVCAFVKDPQRSYKDALLEDKTPVKRCIGASKLKGKFKPFEARRALRSDHDVFIAEDDVIAMLPKLLGKSFYGKQQYVPFPVKMKTKGGKIDAVKVTKSVDQILKSTAVIYPASHTMFVRIASTKHSDKEIAANAKAVVDHLKLSHVLTLSIRTSQSPSLPVYFADKIYDDSDIGDENEDDGYETEGQKRKREEKHIDELLAEVVDEDEIKAYNREQKKRRQRGALSESTEPGTKEPETTSA